MTHLMLVGGEWFERINPELTPEQTQALRDPSKGDAHREAVAAFRERSRRAASEADAAAAQSLYARHSLADATLISAEVTLPSGSGIVNCRVAGKHRQIRF